MFSFVTLPPLITVQTYSFSVHLMCLYSPSGDTSNHISPLAIVTLLWTSHLDNIQNSRTASAYRSSNSCLPGPFGHVHIVRAAVLAHLVRAFVVISYAVSKQFKNSQWSKFRVKFKSVSVLGISKGNKALNIHIFCTCVPPASGFGESELRGWQVFQYCIFIPCGCKSHHG